VLDDVAQHHGVPFALGHGRREQVSGDHVQAQAVAGVSGRELAGLNPERAPAPLARLGQQEADPAAQVHDRARAPGVALDQLERAAGRLALARLFLDVLARLRLAVGLAQLGVAGHALELHVPAAFAAHDVGQRAAVAVGGRDQALRPGVASDLEVRLERGRATGGA
jgi:hypothetical protein